MEKILDTLKQQINNNISIKSIKGNIMQVLMPVYYEDGDMVEIYLEQINDKTIKLSDYGMTMMRLSYYYEVNTDNKIKILNQMLNSNSLEMENGVIYNMVSIDKLYASLMRFSNAIMKISAMSFFKREMIKSLFYEMVDEFITAEFEPKLNIIRNFTPIPGKEEYEVDYCINLPRPIYVFPVKDTPKARLVTISAQEFTIQKIKFHSIVVYEDFNAINQNDQKRILNATDKQFTSFDVFSENGLKWVENM